MWFEINSEYNKKMSFDLDIFLFDKKYESSRIGVSYQYI